MHIVNMNAMKVDKMALYMSAKEKGAKKSAMVVAAELGEDELQAMSESYDAIFLTRNNAPVLKVLQWLKTYGGAENVDVYVIPPARKITERIFLQGSIVPQMTPQNLEAALSY